MEYITNGSFEQIDSCYGQPAGIGFDVFKWSGCKGWSNPIKSSSDLWCENPIIGNQTPPFIPGLGYQNAHTGNNMSGILINDGISFNYREYIQNKLSSNLKIGKSYLLTFYISSNVTDCSPVEIGVKFYNNKLQDASKLWLTDALPDATNDYKTFIVDTLNWQLVTIPFIAKGNEQYAVIGNFEDTTKIKYSIPCDTSFWGNLHLAGNYFFIDDVSIKEAQFKEIIFPDIFTPNNDNVNDFWKVDLSYFETINCSIYNRWGNKIYNTLNPIIIWDGRDTSGNENTAGCYFFTIEAVSIEKEKKDFKGFIQLVR